MLWALSLKGVNYLVGLRVVYWSFTSGFLFLFITGTSSKSLSLVVSSLSDLDSWVLKSVEQRSRTCLLYLDLLMVFLCVKLLMC